LDRVVEKNCTQPRPTELRYRLADFVNDRLRFLPRLHRALKSALERVSAGEAVAQRAEPAATAVPTDLPARREEVSASQPPISLDALPFPPLEMRELIGTADLAAFDNPAGSLVYDYIDSTFTRRCSTSAAAADGLRDSCCNSVPLQRCT